MIIEDKLYSGKRVMEAKLVAIKVHGNQSYDGIYPYEKHLNDVVEVLARFGFGGKYLIAGYLHDSIEDGALSYNKIEKHFGHEVAEMVYCVTDELGRNRKERKEKSYPKLAQNQDAIVIKLADRIANIEHGGKIDMYRNEYNDFKLALYSEHNTTKEMWKFLEKLLLNSDEYE